METWEIFSYMGNFSCFFSFSMRNSTPWASRGRVDLALAELERAGWDLTTIKVIDLNRNPELGPPDLGALLDHLATETVIARAAKDEAGRQDA